jgi:hypothetical protein
MGPMHQFVLDCGATFTNEIYKLTKLSFIPFQQIATEGPRAAERRIAAECTRPPDPPAAPPVAAPSAPSPAPPAAAALPASPAAAP